MEIRATTRLHNNDMISARERLGLSVSDVARLSGVPLSTVYDYERLNYSRKRPETIERHATQIGLVLGIPGDLVAPRDLWGYELPNTHVCVRAVDPAMLLGAVEVRDRRLTLPSPAAAVETEETTVGIESALKALTDREREVINLRFGLADGRTCTLEEVGRMFNVTRESIRLTESRALRKLNRQLSATPITME